MKKIFSFLVFALFCAAASAQTIQAPNSLVFTFPAVTASGPTGALQFSNAATRPSNYTIDVTVTGTPTACTFRVEGSSDNATWYGLDTTAPASTSCTASFMEHIVSKPVLYLRVNLVTWTAGGATAVFHYTGKQN